MKIVNGNIVNDAKGINTQYHHYVINKKRNVEFTDIINITQLYENVLKGSVKVGDIVTIELGDKYVYNAKCQVTEWWDNAIVEIALFDVATCEEIVIKFVK